MPKVTATWTEGYRMDISDGRHQWTADVSRNAGGEDSGPTPFDMLTAALAACQCFVVRRYANTARLPLEAVEVRVDGTFADPDDPATFAMKAEIRVGGDLNERALQRLLRAAEACPIKKAVAATTGVEATIVKA